MGSKGEKRPAPRRVARLTESGLRRLVRQALALLGEAPAPRRVPPPDEPGVAPDEALGQYVMPDGRTDLDYAYVPERDTPLEQELERALRAHYEDNRSDRLAALWDEVAPLAARGLYPDLLVPPDRTAWRFLQGVPPAALAGLLGVGVEEVVGEPEVARTWPRPVSYSRRLRGGEPDPAALSSWTLEPDRPAVRKSFVSWQPERCSVLVAAPVSGGDFLMNPYGFAREFRLGRDFASEVEVISRGPVAGARVAWIYHAPRAEADAAWEAGLEEAGEDLAREVRGLFGGPTGEWDGEEGPAEAFDAWAAFMADVRAALEAPLGADGARRALEARLPQETRAARDLKVFGAWLEGLFRIRSLAASGGDFSRTEAVREFLGERAGWVARAVRALVEEKRGEPERPKVIADALLAALRGSL